MQKLPNLPSNSGLGTESKDRAQLRYRYQGQMGFDASNVMTPSTSATQQGSGTFAEGNSEGPNAATVPSHTSKSTDKGAEDTTDMVHLLHNALDSFEPKRDKRYYVSGVITVLFAVLLVIGSLGSSLAFVAFTPTNAELIAHAHAGFSPEEIKSRQIVAAEILHYVVIFPFEPVTDIDISQEDLDTLRQWSLGEYELCHLTDVRILLGNSLLLSFAITIVSAVIITVFRNKQFVRHSLLAAGIACIAIPAVLGFFILFFFQPTFVIFHEIFFPQGNWQFAPETLLISTLPERYWQAAGLLWMGLFLVNGLILTALSRFCGKMHAWSVTNN
ncbi:MAG: DUF1461 domain-containing protein [Coriobacteriia bacterium]|nr:DUF1461 domain-containing protein [Coriobacteriia bacterium]MCL2871306.1 DUF1461 domain-containing protein [Coriobacteriia bacterium]